MMIQKDPCPGTLLPVDKPDLLFEQGLRIHGYARGFLGATTKSDIPTEKIDHDRFYIGQIVRKERDIVFSAFRIEEMRPGNIRISLVQGLESIGASCIG